MNDQLIPIVAILATIGLPVAGWIMSIMFRHRERMELLRRGMIPPEFLDKNAYRAWRRAGSPWPPPGSAMGGPPPGQGAWTPSQPQPVPWPTAEDDPQRMLFKGIRVALIGLALTIGLGALFGGFRGNPAILGGLIPMFVGVAQVIIALLSGAVLPGVVGQPSPRLFPPPGPPPGGNGAASPGASGFAGTPSPPPWAEQPGRPRFEELSKPVNPPDLR